MARPKRIAFLASHLLSPSVASGGDILFCEIAARIQQRRPDWELVAVVPDFASGEMQRFFGRLAIFRTRHGEGCQGSPAAVAKTWLSRLNVTVETLLALEPDLIHSTGDFFIDVWPVIWAWRRLAVKWSGVVHHINAPPLRRRNDVVVAGASYVLQRLSFRALRQADSISVLNQQVRADLCGLRFPNERVHVVGAGIDTNRFCLLPSRGSARRVLWLNRLEPTKGIFDLPKIARRLPEDVVIDVVGRGPESHLVRLRRALESERVAHRCVIHGFLSDNELYEIARRSSVFISCSYEEGWGISIAEALSMGLRCVAYDLPSHEELFGDTIVRVPVGDTAMFVKRLIEQLDRPDTDAERNARREIAKRYSLDTCAIRQEAIFASLINDP